MGKAKIELRKVHKVGFALRIGSKADLEMALIKEGFSYKYQKGRDPFMEGIQIHEDPLGVQRILKRVEKGKPARWLHPTKKQGMLVKIRTAQMPDVWAILKPKKGRGSLG